MYIFRCSRGMISFRHIVLSLVILLLCNVLVSLSMSRRETLSAAIHQAAAGVGRLHGFRREKETTIVDDITDTQSYEAYVISFHSQRMRDFIDRNTHTGLANKTTWFPAVDGDDPVVQQEWMELTGRHGTNATQYFKEKKDDTYRNAHAVGCFLSHWHLLRMVGAREEQYRPDLLFIFEEDASCAPDLRYLSLEITAKLPEDWDLFYIGGKHFTYYGRGVWNSNFKRDIHARYRIPDKNPTERDKATMNARFRTLACNGTFGKGEGPLAPDGSRDLFRNQTYWQTKYTLNTEAYVVNTKRIGHILNILSPRKNGQTPVDVAYANALRKGQLRGYLPTETFCKQMQNSIMNVPEPWEGFFYLPLVGWNFYHWDKLLYEECPGKY